MELKYMENDAYYLRKIHEEVRFITDSMADINQDNFNANKLLQNG